MRSAAGHQLALKLQHKCQQHDNHVQRQRKFTYNIINTQLWERESARALQTIRIVGFLQKLSTIDDVTKYGIQVSRYFETVYYRLAFPNSAHP